MEPHLKLFLDQRFQYDTLAVKLEKYIQNYEEFKSLYFQNGKSQSIIQQLQQQMTELESRIEQLQQTDQFTINEINKKVDLLQISKDQHLQQITLLDKIQSQSLQSIENFRQQNQQFKQVLLENIDQVNLQNNIAVNNVQDKLLEVNLRIDNQYSYQKDLTLKNDRIFEELSSLNNKMIQQISQTSHDQKNIELLQQIVPKFDELLAQDRYVTNELLLMKNKQSYFENYIEKYFPLFLQGTISQTLHNCLDDNNIYRLAKFEEEKFTLLNTIIVEDKGTPDLDKKIHEYTAFIEAQLKRNFQILKNNVNNQSIKKNEQSRESQNVYPQQKNKQDFSGIQNLLEKNEIEYFIQQRLNEFKKQIDKNFNQLSTTVDTLESTYDLLHQKMISQFELIKTQHNQQILQIEQQLQDLNEQFSAIPLFIKEINDIQQQQQQNIKKLNQFQILNSEKNQSESQLNDQRFTLEQCQDILNESIYQLKNENDSIYQESPIKKLSSQLNADDRKSVRTKTASQSGMRKSIKSMYSSSQTRSSNDKRKFYLLGSKLQQEVCQSMNLSILQPRKTNSRILFQSKAYVKD
ncbi:unnamed protein product (macronuclear) [Paramecium tetraurelia]|uniref:Uncharacterized protein n=1 Tax=Paramecium tetraurelia TaxID=5888 RepID=A0C9K7_PARTE|nr:uncharacterized protein GSPATT00006780001 [Paramecium tetraurelia]CAK67474.1 unnamed protein product [Paramecium tetraurelia]|eukprot:XP_001434871.1 hypothetical protein (macronuclear) [Paramecium tetraurelia strain d4-2]